MTIKRSYQDISMRKELSIVNCQLSIVNDFSVNLIAFCCLVTRRKCS
ncbi:MAG: hypothetical protein JSV88_02430 [Candidatus Aminicenantes bacterium]|nr:MAG: hypothetical protein JSV88_02430 [Candidatus Aminicenantes bacterium]